MLLNEFSGTRLVVVFGMSADVWGNCQLVCGVERSPKAPPWFNDRIAQIGVGNVGIRGDEDLLAKIKRLACRWEGKE